MKKLNIILVLLLAAITTIGQNSVDVLRYSQFYNGGTARYMSMGGAFAALGADFSTLSSNPAGIAIYKKSEFTFTPAIYFSKSASNTNNFEGRGNKDNLNINNFGLVMVQNMNEDNDGWKSFQFGVGLNRRNNFNREVNIVNHNHFSSLISDYQDQSYGLYPSDLDAFSTDLAWKTFLFNDTIRVNSGALAYTSALNKGGAKQTERILQWGSVNEMVFALGGSYNDQFYIGGSIGFPRSRYFEQLQHTEIDDADTIVGFKSFTMNRYLETKGSGVNFKFGMIFRPTDILRFGLAFESPTWYSMSDYYYNDMKQIYENGQSATAKSPNGNFDYGLTTPMKLNGSIAVIIDKMMIVSTEAEYINYASGYLNSRVYNFSNENMDVENKYQSAFNVKGGFEIRMSPFAFRLGTAYYGNPYQSGVNQSHKLQLSGGIGYRDGNFFIDMAYVYSKSSENYYMYDPIFVDASLINYNDHQILMTFGMKL